MNGLSWTGEQHALVRKLIAEEIEKARLCHKFIPEFTLAEDARSVAADEFDDSNNLVDDIKTIPLVEIEAKIKLTKLQAEDADLSAALLLIRRAANRLARLHDAIVFTGQTDVNKLPVTATGLGSHVAAIGGSKNQGLYKNTIYEENVLNPSGSYGEDLVSKVAKALVHLEGKGYIGSYVLVLGQTFFTDVNTRSNRSFSRDRIESLLEGPVYRSSVLEDCQGLLVSMGGEPMDRAVAVAPKFEFLRIGSGEARECRVFERFALRIKEKDCIFGFKA